MANFFQFRTRIADDAVQRNSLTLRNETRSDTIRHFCYAYFRDHSIWCLFLCADVAMEIENYTSEHTHCFETFSIWSASKKKKKNRNAFRLDIK